MQQSSLDFYDFNIKIFQRLGENGTLALSAYNSHDYFSYRDQFGFYWDMSNFSLMWNQTFGKSLFSEFSVSGNYHQTPLSAFRNRWFYAGKRHEES
ncbi:MAG: hypothetical protein U5K79_14340 [Cyclobacteriaceae bacterium]|nr:hypothetical protein [Cyclobacteriaceae bacterium]